MKFRIFFSVSKTERKLRLRFWKWDVWRLDSDSKLDIENFVKNSSKAGFLSLKKKSENETAENSELNKLLFQVFFYPEVENKIWHVVKKLITKILNMFSVGFEDIEIKGAIGDPFYDSIALGISGGCYFPDWENENADCSAKGMVILKTNIFKFLFFIFFIIYNALYLIFVLWRGYRLAKNNPNCENLSNIRKWLFLKSWEAL